MVSLKLSLHWQTVPFSSLKRTHDSIFVVSCQQLFCFSTFALALLRRIAAGRRIQLGARDLRGV
jgi:hypothetical protein